MRELRTSRVRMSDVVSQNETNHGKIEARNSQHVFMSERGGRQNLSKGFATLPIQRNFINNESIDSSEIQAEGGEQENSEKD